MALLGFRRFARLPSPDWATRFAPTRCGTVVGGGGLGGGRSSIPGCQPGSQRVSLPRAGDPGPADHCRTEGETSVGARRRLALPDVPARRCEAPPRPYGFGRRDRNCRSGGVESWVGACRARRGGRRGGWRPGGRPIPPPPACAVGSRVARGALLCHARRPPRWPTWGDRPSAGPFRSPWAVPGCCRGPRWRPGVAEGR